MIPSLALWAKDLALGCMLHWLRLQLLFYPGAGNFHVLQSNTFQTKEQDKTPEEQLKRIIFLKNSRDREHNSCYQGLRVEGAIDGKGEMGNF